MDGTTAYFYQFAQYIANPPSIVGERKLADFHGGVSSEVEINFNVATCITPHSGHCQFSCYAIIHI